MSQWQRAIQPALRRRAHIKVIINGQDMTDPLRPYLISVKVISKLEGPDTCFIELDDRNAELPIPPRMSTVRVEIGWEGSPPTLPLLPHIKRIYQMTVGKPPPNYITDSMPWESSSAAIFTGGLLQSVESGFSRRGGGRRLWLEAWNSDLTETKLKQPMYHTTGTGKPGDNKPVTEFFNELLAKVGGGFKFVPLGDVSNLTRDFWVANNESPLHVLRRIAGETGYATKIVGKNIFLIPKVDLGNAYGELAMPTVEAVWGINLIGWRIKPFVGRIEWAGSHSMFFDRYQGLWKGIKSALAASPFGGSAAIARMGGAAPNEHVGQQFNDENDIDAQIDRGTGYVIINGEPAAQAGGNVVIVGARPGVDGNWGIKEVEHDWSRASGYTTRIDIRRPELDANAVDRMKDQWNNFQEQGTPVAPQADENWPPGLPVPLPQPRPAIAPAR